MSIFTLLRLLSRVVSLFSIGAAIRFSEEEEGKKELISLPPSLKLNRGVEKTREEATFFTCCC